jgi:tRNA1(Val) A37 N6-methylase TrmN6
MAHLPERGETTTDSLLGGSLLLDQPARGHGYRLNVDAFLLAREALLRAPFDHAVDLGAGVGPVGLSLLLFGGVRRVTLVEREPWVASLARRNAGRLREGLCEGINVLSMSVEDLPPGLQADLVVSNPPFTPEDEGRPPPEARRAQARHGALDPFLQAAAATLAPGGLVLFIYPASALPRIISLATPLGLHLIRMRMVHATPTSPARVALFWLAGAAAPLALDSPCFERTAGGAPSPDLERFLRGPG